MEIQTNHKIFYSNKKHIPIKDIAESLIAIEELIQQTPSVLEALFPGTSIYKIEVTLNELQVGSLWEDIGVKFIFGSQKNLDNFIESARDTLGMEKLVSNPQLFSSILAVLILSGGAYYLGASKSEPEKKAIIEANNNVIINIGADIIDMSAEDLKDLIEAAVQDKSKLSKTAVKIVGPAKHDPEASIEFDQNPDIRIESQSVKAMPYSVTDIEKEEEVEDFSNLEIVVRATDLDSHKRGWAAVLPSMHETRRVRLQLDPTVDPDQIMKNPKFVGNATVMFRFNEKQERIPYLVFLREVIQPEVVKK